MIISLIFNQLEVASEKKNKIFQINPMNSGCSSCRKMLKDKIPYFLTFKDLYIILSDYGKKNINTAINEDILNNSNVHIDDNFLAKRYQLLTDYPVIYFTNSN